MISDLNLNIDHAQIKWSGPFDDPTISFNGSEVFRILPDEISSSGAGKKERVPVTVIASLNESTINDIDFHFDIKSNNSQVGSLIDALPSETRESYAINLLLFGTLNPTEGFGGSSLMQNVVAKLNEISRRNIRNADLSFYMDSDNEAESSSLSSLSKFGYSFSKGLFNKKLRFSIGGNINFGADAPIGAKRFNPFGNLELDYILSRDPDITMFLARNNVYKGAFDGQVDESSIGINYEKRFHNLFRLNKQRGK